jgi:fibrillarin-like rRNA methylase
MGDLEKLPVDEKITEPVIEVVKDPITVLKEKFEEYPEFVRLSESEKIDVLVIDYAQRKESEELVKRQDAFYEARASALTSQIKAGLEEVERARVKVYKEKLELERVWNEAAANGNWEMR